MTTVQRWQALTDEHGEMPGCFVCAFIPFAGYFKLWRGEVWRISPPGIEETPTCRRPTREEQIEIDWAIKYDALQIERHPRRGCPQYEYPPKILYVATGVLQEATP